MPDDNKEVAPQERPSRLHVHIGPLDIDMRNTPRMAFIIVAIGLCFLLVLIGMHVLGKTNQEGFISQIVARLLDDDPITTKEATSIENMTPAEKQRLFKALAAEVSKVAPPADTGLSPIHAGEMAEDPIVEKKEIVLPVEGGALLRIEQSSADDAPVSVTIESDPTHKLKTSAE